VISARPNNALNGRWNLRTPGAKTGNQIVAQGRAKMASAAQKPGPEQAIPENYQPICASVSVT
jgi:hypothetical protein